VDTPEKNEKPELVKKTK